MTPIALLLALVACKKDEVPTDDTADTEDTSVNTDDSADSEDTGELCTAKPSEFSPREDSTSHYYRDPKRFHIFNMPTEIWTTFYDCLNIFISQI